MSHRAFALFVSCLLVALPALQAQEAAGWTYLNESKDKKLQVSAMILDSMQMLANLILLCHMCRFAALLLGLMLFVQCVA
jgi:hypothetical protein